MDADGDGKINLKELESHFRTANPLNDATDQVESDARELKLEAIKKAISKLVKVVNGTVDLASYQAADAKYMQ